MRCRIQRGALAADARNVTRGADKTTPWQNCRYGPGACSAARTAPPRAAAGAIGHSGIAVSAGAGTAGRAPFTSGWTARRASGAPVTFRANGGTYPSWARALAAQADGFEHGRPRCAPRLAARCNGHG